MNRRLALVVGALGLATLTQVDTADAGRYRFSGGGGAHARVRGNVSVTLTRPSYVRGWSRPHRSWGVGGRIYVGSGGYYPRYRYYYPRYYYYPVPSYYGYGYYNSYHPVEPTAAPGVAAPSTVTTVVAPERPPLPRFGIGVFAGGVQVGDIEDSTDVGVLGRLRLGGGGLLIEGEIGKTEFENDARVDRRLGGSLIYEIGARNALAPYLLGGVGVQQADVAGEFTTTQNFGEIGIGLRWALSTNLHLLFDVRAGTRASVSDDRGDRPIPADTAGRSILPPGVDSNEGEDYTRARLSAMLYF